MTHQNSTLSSRQRRMRWLLPMFLLLFVTVACRLSLGGKQAPTDRTPVTPPVQAQDWRTLLANAQPGDTIEITLTEADLTTLLARQAASLDNISITDPRVILTNGQIEVYGTAETSSISGNFQAVINVLVENGRARGEIETANVGSIPVPSSITERMTTAMNDALANATGTGPSRLYLNRVDLFEGYMTVLATVQ
jgi:hypothetical protein